MVLQVNLNWVSESGWPVHRSDHVYVVFHGALWLKVLQIVTQDWYAPCLNLLVTASNKHCIHSFGRKFSECMQCP